jgi:hypothetical protein
MGQKEGLVRELNPGPLAPEARIIPLDQRADIFTGLLYYTLFFMRKCVSNNIDTCYQIFTDKKLDF